MKITNYNIGYVQKFDCSIHGTLHVTKEEFKKILPVLKKYSYDFEDSITKNYIVDKFGNHFYSFGVTPMDKINAKYKLARYKRANYQIKLHIK